MGADRDISMIVPRALSGTTPAFVRARWRAWGALVACLAGVWVSAGLGGDLGIGAVWWFTAGGACAAAGLVTPGRWWWVPAWLGLWCLAGGWAGVRFREPAPDRLDRLVAEASIVTVHGFATATPVRWERPTGPGAPGQWRADSVWFPLRVTGVRGGNGEARASGVVRVYGGVGLEGRVRAGDAVTLTGVFGAPGGARNPGEPDWTRLGNELGRAGSVSVGDGELVVATAAREGWRTAWAGAVRGREWVRARALVALGVGAADAAGERGGGVVGALVLGERDRSFDGVYRVFQRAGVAHVLAVSGFHVALLCGLAAMAVRATGERGRLETLAVLLVVVTLLVFVPARSPIVRACVLALALILGDLIGRRWDRLAVLAWAGVGLLAWRPSEALSLGYLLSVGVTALLLAMAEQRRAERWWLLTRGVTDARRGWVSGAFRRAGGWVWGALRLNTACWAVSTPTIIVATGVLSVLAPVATVVIVPLAGVLLVLGWAQALLGVAWPGGAAATRPAVDACAGWTGAVAGWFDGLPGSSVLLAGVGWWWAAFATGALLGWLFWRERRWMFAALIVLSGVYAGAAAAAWGRVDGVRADMFDVGDGTSVLVRSGGDALLWDCGSLQREVGDRVADAARALGVRRIPTVVITHPDSDHYNGLLVLAERMGVERVVMPAAFLEHRDGAWGQTRAALEAAGVLFVGLRTGDRFDLGAARGEVLWPPAERPVRGLDNERSLVLRLTVETARGPRRLLLTGDIQQSGIAGLEAAGADIGATVLEVPHHGSAIPAAFEFVARSGPAVALQSTGASRRGDERWDDVRARTRWLSTAERGAVHAWLRADGSVVSGGWRD